MASDNGTFCASTMACATDLTSMPEPVPKLAMAAEPALLAVELFAVLEDTEVTIDHSWIKGTYFLESVEDRKT